MGLCASRKDPPEESKPPPYEAKTAPHGKTTPDNADTITAAPPQSAKLAEPTVRDAVDDAAAGDSQKDEKVGNAADEAAAGEKDLSVSAPEAAAEGSAPAVQTENLDVAPAAASAASATAPLAGAETEASIIDADSIIDGSVAGAPDASGQGAELEKTDAVDSGATASLVAAIESEEWTEAEQILKDAESLDPNVRTTDWGYTVLRASAEEGAAAVCRGLIGRGADVNARDVNDITPLIGCIVGGDFGEIVEMLLEAKADPAAITTDGCLRPPDPIPRTWQWKWAKCSLEFPC